MNIKSNIPNILTICNLICGLVSVTLVMEGNIVMAAVFIFIAGVFEFAADEDKGAVVVER